ncbi:serine hydrolase domain-containing protein [Streptomyces sp. MS1.HAVA.3]|uniref:Serine hydrolase domain-containing protein n=1 Tax=Streptomyces caledonius TaxID=3134107 RepID=A0ABU8UBK4_9ACTN
MTHAYAPRPRGSRRRGPPRRDGGNNGDLRPQPPPPPQPSISDDAVDKAVARLDRTVADMMRRTGVPGVSVAVVHDDEVVHLKGFGVRRTGQSAAVDPDTVFQIASLSKPVSSTVVAGTLTDPDGWDRHTALPGFSLKDPWVTDHVTTADLFSHRSGLPDHAGDLLEDLGYDQSYILDHLRLEPLTPFRSSYAYTNFGFTAAAEAVARAKGTSWQKLSEDTLFKPAGMTRTSTEFSAFVNAPDHAATHVKNPDGTWSPRYVRDPDAQAPPAASVPPPATCPAGCGSSSPAAPSTASGSSPPPRSPARTFPRSSLSRPRPPRPAPASTASAGTSPTTTPAACA